MIGEPLGFIAAESRSQRAISHLSSAICPLTSEPMLYAPSVIFVSHC